MIHFVIANRRTGAIESSNTGYSLPPTNALPADRVAVPVPAPLDTRSHRLEDGHIVSVGLPPTAHHQYNPASRQWELDTEAAWRAARNRRNDLMVATDWVVLRAADRGEPVPPEWLAYRQALRDVTAQTDPLNIAWPVAPAA